MPKFSQEKEKERNFEKPVEEKWRGLKNEANLENTGNRVPRTW